MRIAIVGAGVSGLAAAAALHPAHEVTVLEAADHVGGHAQTVRVEVGGREVHADVGFMVWNEVTYPRLLATFERLGVASAPTSMGFSMSDRRNGLEWAGETLDSVFAQRRNLLRPAFWRMLSDIVRFNREAPGWVEGPHAHSTLGELIAREGLSAGFRDGYLVPMGAAIWSASEHDMERFPAAFFVRFLRNHGMLEPPSRQFRWRVVTGGSRHYVEAIARPFADRVRRSMPVRGVRRVEGGVEVATDAGAERFDEVVLATHADVSLALLSEATPREREALEAFPYRANRALLHTDVRALPRARRAWSSWNYLVPADRGAPVSVTYDLSRLQHLDTPSPLLLTLNDPGLVDPARVLRTFDFTHPAYTHASTAAQERWAEVSGRDRVHFCGAYWRNGFHEDGFVSGERVAAAILARGGA